VSGYRLDNWAIEIRSPSEARDFSSNLCAQTGSGAHPASCTMGTGGPFAGGKARPGRDATTHPHLVPRSRMSRNYTYLPLRLHRCVVGLLCLSKSPFMSTYFLINLPNPEHNFTTSFHAIHLRVLLVIQIGWLLVKLSQYSANHRALKTYVGMEVQLIRELSTK
jgi:hypothetical protein